MSTVISPVLAAIVPCHLSGVTPIAAAIICSVPDVPSRVNKNLVSSHGETPELEPKPKTKYAASALIDLWLDSVGTTKVIGCTGPEKSPTFDGSPFGRLKHVVGKTSEMPRSVTTPGLGMSHESIGAESSAQ